MFLKTKGMTRTNYNSTRGNKCTSCVTEFCSFSVLMISQGSLQKPRCGVVQRSFRERPDRSDRSSSLLRDGGWAPSKKALKMMENEPSWNWGYATFRSKKRILKCVEFYMLISGNFLYNKSHPQAADSFFCVLGTCANDKSWQMGMSENGAYLQ